MTPAPQPLARDELSARLRLLATPGLSQPRILALLQAYGSATAVQRVLARVCGAVIAAAAQSREVCDRVERAQQTIERERIEVIGYGEPIFPWLAWQRLGVAAPPVLFARGDITLLRHKLIAVVGARVATEYGLDMADEIGSAAARAGACVVSGLARGVDTAAHLAALDEGGGTIAVLGCGVDVHYPRENRRLQERIARDGLLLSEFLPGTSPKQHHFPHRNRIIAALSSTVVVVEAGEGSGALHTANHAADYGLNVYCVMPGLHEPQIAGGLQLVREGAHLFTGSLDVLETEGLVAFATLDLTPQAEAEQAPFDPLAKRLLHALGKSILHIDELAARANMTPAEANRTLMELEFEGRVRCLPGGHVRRSKRRDRRTA